MYTIIYNKAQSITITIQIDTAALTYTCTAHVYRGEEPCTYGSVKVYARIIRGKVSNPLIHKCQTHLRYTSGHNTEQKIHKKGLR